MRLVFMVVTGMEQFLSIPDDLVSTWGRPTKEVRFNVRLCVAKKATSRPS